ncbi:MAG: immunoglobulin domain-containing protein [Opitutaceae bacterium]|jgi:hypothetical protein
MIMRTLRLTCFFALLFNFLGVVDGFAATAKPAKAKITLQPVKQTLELWDTLTLTVGVSSTTMVSYQWRFNKTPINGANAATYSLEEFTAASAGKYDVVITNDGGSVTSRTVVISINLAPASLPVGTALYDQITGRILKETIESDGSLLVTGADTITDPEDETGNYSFKYKRINSTHATLVITGDFYDADFGGRIGTTVSYKLMFTGVAPEREREFKCSGKGVYILPKGYKPAKIPFTFSGKTSIDLPE